MRLPPIHHEKASVFKAYTTYHMIKEYRRNVAMGLSVVHAAHDVVDDFRNFFHSLEGVPPTSHMMNQIKHFLIDNSKHSWSASVSAYRPARCLADVL